MKTILDEVIKIVESYNLKKIELDEPYKTVYDLIKDNPELKKNFISEKNDWYFLKKYENYISDGHYGFSLGEPIIPEWCEIIDKVLELCISYDENFKIKQIKVKFGGVCFYTQSEIISDLQSVDIYMFNVLRDKTLIY